jgi:hypothetical protein
VLHSGTIDAGLGSHVTAIGYQVPRENAGFSSSMSFRI